MDIDEYDAPEGFKVSLRRFGKRMPNITLNLSEALGEKAGSLQVYVDIDRRVDEAEHDGIMARWEFGRELVKEKQANGGKQLPHGLLDEVCAVTGKSRSEVQYRVQFAEKFPDREEVSNALDTFGSWRSIVHDALPEDNHRAKGTGENEWYTPVEYIDKARDVMGGIDLDPASSDEAQRRVLASEYFTVEDDGLSREWHGRVWLNPPYSQPAIQHFAEKTVQEVSAGRVEQAIVLTHNYTDTEWFHLLAGIADYICFTKGRIAFEKADGDKASPTQGQAFFYFGPNQDEFKQVFSGEGFVR